jgi:predicted enzyme related to lactoylglutathione lyase
MIRHVAGMAEIVEDIDKAIAFYRDVLGLETQRHNDDYAIVTVPGVLHFGIWDRRAAAESTLGSRDAAERIPLGFTLEFEVEDVADAATAIEANGGDVLQKPRTEPWGQKTCRLISHGGGLLGLAETPWAREITTPMQVAGSDARESGS